MTPDELYRAMADCIEDVCGGTSAVRKEPISLVEWHDIRMRFDLICSVNMPRLEKPDDR